MKKQNLLLSGFLSLLILLLTVSPAFAASPRVLTEPVIPPEPDGAVVFPEGASTNIDWDGLTKDMWNLLFTGTKRTINIEKYHVPVSDANKDAIFFPCWYNPRFLRTAPVNLSRSGGYYVSINNLDTTKTIATDPAENRAKYDACADAVAQLTYGIKGNDAISQADKALLLHDRLAAWTAYDYTDYYGGTLPDDSPDYNAYGPLVNHLGVCNGYALAYNWLLEDVGICAWYENSKTINHGWSKVELDGACYYTDVTWDDPVIDIPGRVYHENFLCSSAVFANSHEADDFDMTLTSEQYSEYVSNAVQSEIVRIGDANYMFAENVLQKQEADGTVTELFSVERSKQIGAHQYTMQPKLLAFGSTILYLTLSQVRAYDTLTGDDSLVYTPTSAILRNETYLLNGLRQVDGTVYVTSVNNRQGTFSETTVAQNTESFVYCTHPTWEKLETTNADARYICPVCRALRVEHAFSRATVSSETLKAPATCTTPAVYYYTCENCGAIASDDADTFRSGSANGHDWRWIADLEPTCGNGGIMHQVCAACAETRYENTAVGPTGDHNYTAQTISADALQSAATCTAPASYYYSCAVCGSVEGDDAHTFIDGEPIAHSWTWVVDTPPTCGAAGVQHEVCTACQLTRSENTAIDPTGDHSYTAQTVSADALQSAATCTAPASYYYSCAVCGSVEGDDAHTFTDGEPTAHSWTWVVDTPPTCGAAGVQHEACTACQLTRSENTAIDPTGDHSYTAQTVSAEALKSAATCTAPASYYYSCAVCGSVEGDDAHTFTDGEPAAHSWTWVVDTPPTCGAAGVQHEACTACQLTRSENTAIDPTGDHSYTAQTVSADALQSAATCTAPASYYYSCAVCGTAENNDSHTFTTGAALGHAWQETARTKASCTNAGSVTYTCTHDSTHVFTEELPQLSHADNNGDGYCDSCGKDLQGNRCPYCGQTHTGFWGLIVGFFHRILALFK